jgi:hypothetical protein
MSSRLRRVMTDEEKRNKAAFEDQAPLLDNEHKQVSVKA